MGKHAGVVCYKMGQNPGIVGSRTLEQIIKWWDPWMVWTRGNANCENLKRFFNLWWKQSHLWGRCPLFWETTLVSPFHKVEVKDLPWATGGTLLTYWTKDSRNLEGKVIQSVHIPCVARARGLKRAQGSPLWGKLLFDASDCAKDETTRWVGNGPQGILCTRMETPWRAWVAAEILSLDKGTWLWRFCVGITSKPQQPGNYLGA